MGNTKKSERLYKVSFLQKTYKYNKMGRIGDFFMVENKPRKLYTEDGKEAGIVDICEWWISTYPEDIFKHQENVVNIRKNCKFIMKVMKHE
jgi:hypothetical protein